MNRIQLISYHSSWFSVLHSWVISKDVLLLYSGTHFSFPLTEAQMNAYAQEFPHRKMYIGLLNSRIPFAFGEIIPQNEYSVRLARILIGDPEMRGKGLGLAFVNSLIEEAHNTFAAKTIDLFVFDSNEKAIRCYQRAGFSFTDEAAFSLVVDGTTYQVRKMSLLSE